MSSRGWAPRQLARPLLIAVLAGGLYGSWAALVHHDLGAGVALRVGLTQAALSTTFTLVIVLVLEALFRWPSNPVHGFWLAYLGTLTLAITCLVVGHTMAGTPRIVAAIAPPVVVCTILFFVHARRMLAHAKRAAPSREGVTPSA